MVTTGYPERMVDDTSPRMAVVTAADLIGLIDDTQHHCMARYVALRDGGSKAYLCETTGVWALGGPLCARLEVPECWARVHSPGQLLHLRQRLDQDGHEGSIACVAPFPGQECIDELRHDLHFVLPSTATPADQGVEESDGLHTQDFREGRLHPEIADLLGPLEALIEDFGGLDHFIVARSDGMVVAMAETLVRTERFAAIQQVYTASDFRGQGLGSRVVNRAMRVLLRCGLKPLYVCDSENLASIATAEGAGLVKGFVSPNIAVNRVG